MIRIVLADDDKFIRQTLCSYLESESDIEIIATAENGKIALQLIAELHPDLAFLDIEMPEIDGLTATKTICQHFPQTKAVVLSSYDDREYVNKAIQAGAIGYLLKNITAEELAQAIRFLDKGYLQLAPGLSSKLSSTASPPLDAKNTSMVASKIAASGEPRSIAQTSSNVFFNVELEDYIPRFNRRTNIGGSVLLVILGLMATLASFSKDKIIVKAPAIINANGTLHPVTAAIEKQVRTIEVSENQVIKAGEIIATLDDSQLQAQKRQLQKNRKRSFEQLNLINNHILDLNWQIAEQQRIIARISASSEANVNINRLKEREKQVSIQAELEKTTEEIKLVQEELNRYRQLELKGAISQLQLEQKESALTAARSKLKLLSEFKHGQRSQVALNWASDNSNSLNKQIVPETEQRQGIKDTLEREKEALEEKKNSIRVQIGIYVDELQKLEANQNKTIVRAPLSGIVRQLNLTNKQQFVKAGEIVAEIVSSESPLVVKTFVGDRDIDRIKIGQSAKLKISACPNSDYVTLEGTVSAIAPKISKPQQQANAFVPDRAYEVTIQPKKSELQKNEPKCRIQAGMKGRVEIIDRQETLLTFLFKTIMPSEDRPN
ncbi:MAG: response regulator [Xenococcaceae cyanobacterium]